MKKLYLITMLTCSIAGYSQNRISEENTLLWTPLVVNTKLNDKFSLLTEYQWRRTNFGKNPQQQLLRFGLTHSAGKTISLQAGYAWILTHPYGNYPIAENGTFAEHRTHQQVVFNTSLNTRGTALISRIRLEQRWLAILNSDGSLNHWKYLNRIRLNQRINFPFKAVKKNCYASVMDEIFIGFGKNLGLNVFDQNRLFVLFGININPKMQLEIGAVNQILQQGKAVGGKAVFQYNTGPVAGINLKL